MSVVEKATGFGAGLVTGDSVPFAFDNVDYSAGSTITKKTTSPSDTDVIRGAKVERTGFDRQRKS